ncbi:MAG: DUF1302 family protein [Gammaproteobacteria bacterium]
MKQPPGCRRTLALVAACLSTLTGTAVRADEIGDTFSKFDRAMATFNPLGEYVRKPIERALPRLTFRGALRQWSDVLIDSDDRVGFREQDFRFLQLQNLLELETFYNVAPGLDINAVTHAMYDGVYDWQHSSGLYADRLDRTNELYDNAERILRELYVSYRTPGFDLMLGKQQVIWGKMDGQFIDIINGMDRRESVQLETEDYELRRLPTWMANTTFHFGRNSLQLLYIFDFEQDRQPAPGSPWFSPLIPPPGPGSDIVLPVKRVESGDFGDHEFGLRFDRSAGALTYGMIYAYLWDKNPVNHVVGTETIGGTTLLRLQPRHERLHHVGITADYATTLSDIPWMGTLPAVFRLEALWTKGVRFVDFTKQAAARAGVATDGTAQHDTLRAAVAAEFGLPANTTMILQTSYYHTFGWNPALGYGFGGGFADEWSLIPVFYLSRPFAFTRDRLSAQFTAFPVISGPDREWQGIKTKLRVKYKFSQFVSGQLIYNGYDAGDPTDLYGQYDEWDNFGWELSYEF